MGNKILPIVLLIGGTFITIAGVVSREDDDDIGKITGIVIIVIGIILFFAMGNKKDNDTNK